MPNLIVLRLHPDEPTTAGDFSGYLSNLTIRAFDMTFALPGGNLIGEARFLPGDPNSRIVQHLKLILNPSPPPAVFQVSQAIATAIIELPAGLNEYISADIRLEMQRGTREIIDKSVHYNVPVIFVPTLPDSTDPFEYSLLGESLFVALPAPGIERDPSLAFVDLADDGTPPEFGQLRAAVINVLSEDPQGVIDDLFLANLTAEQCRHIAYEIVWNRQLNPAPTPGIPIEDMYTNPPPVSLEDPGEPARRMFEAELLGYNATNNARAERLSKFIFSMAAAIFAQTLSAAATHAAFEFPTSLSATPGSTRVKEETTIISNANPSSNLAALGLSYDVPAEYFYALGAIFPTAITAQQRYDVAILSNEQQNLQEIQDAVAAGIIALPVAPAANPEQAVRRMSALGAIRGVTNQCPLSAATPVVNALVNDWLDFTGADIDDFWTAAAIAAHASAHLDLILCILTENHAPLIAAIKAMPVADAVALSAITLQQWQQFFQGKENLLPPFTIPASPDEARQRVDVFITKLRTLMDLAIDLLDPPPIVLDTPGLFSRSTMDPLQRFAANFKLRAGVDFEFGTGVDHSSANFLGALADTFPTDMRARAWLDNTLRVIDDLFTLADIGLPDLRFSLVEALYARGFDGPGSIAPLTLVEFRKALTGTVAFDHATAIHTKAGGAPPAPAPSPDSFQPINPDGTLTNCIPPPHLSPLGPVAYLSEALKVSHASTCADPFPVTTQGTIGSMTGSRRGPLGNLHATASNLMTPIPWIDFANECLEAIAANIPGSTAGVVYDTGMDELAGHQIKHPYAKTSEQEEPFRHDATTLFAALPEHSSPATPVAVNGGYDRLKSDFSSIVLPYSQPLDISRSYLHDLRTSRYAVMRRFRKDITEFVLDPNNEPVGFDRHLWRYPVRIDIAREYLGITPEEYDLLFTTDIADTTTTGRLLLRELYGFDSDTVDGVDWKDIVSKLSEFLRRTGLTYCEFIELWKSEFVRFHMTGSETGFPDCEPCYLDKFQITFDSPSDKAKALRRLIVFIRLWRKLKSVKNASYSFTNLRDICEVLVLFDASGAINPEFIRQLAAFQILRDHFDLELVDGADKTPDTGAGRTHLLALWVGPTARKFSWARNHLLRQIQHYALARYHCGCREPQFIKVLAENLDALSILSGFDPGTPAETWNALPTHTLRFAEILAKIYASDFSPGEILFLFTVDEHVGGDDPFPLQPSNEAKEFPLSLPDDEQQYSLLALRRKLLEADVSDEEAASWTWLQIEASLRRDFGYVPPAGPTDPLRSLGEHFFPLTLESEGLPVDMLKRQYRVGLAATVAAMWNTPPNGPFIYDSAAKELSTQIPLSDEAVFAKLSRIRQLSTDEQTAVRDLYYLPRVDLVPFLFLFANAGQAEELLIQEPDESKRWDYFRRAFARCYKRCRIISEHLARHVVAATGREAEADGADLAWRILKSLFADENRATSTWEDDNGQPPQVTWKPQPNGGAFAALLGVTGIGLLGEFKLLDGTLIWREVRGPMDAFSAARNAMNSPVPTLLPSMSLTFPTAQQRFVAVRNGFALKDDDATPLGGTQGFRVTWTGVLLVDGDGLYEFRAGAPTPEGEDPDFECARHSRWRVSLRRGQKFWILLSHNYDHEAEAAPACSVPLMLKRGAYDLIIEFEEAQPTFATQEDVCRQLTGFQLKYTGPDTDGSLVTVPLDHLFIPKKDGMLSEGITLSGPAKIYLEQRFTSTLRDVRRTYQRAFKAMLFAHRLGLSAKPVSDDEESEIGYMLAHAQDFAGKSFFRAGAVFTQHLAKFDFNFLPGDDNYRPPTAVEDQRVQPSVKRRRALFDWWERLFDYTTLRREAQTAPERPVWLLFHEAAEDHPDDPAQLLRHMGVDISNAELVLRYFAGFHVATADLEDERWPIRVWQGEKWIRALLLGFSVRDIRDAQPALWAADDPGIPLVGDNGNKNLTKFTRDGYLEHGDPHRYLSLKRLNDGLRLRARAALLAYLSGMNRVPLPWGGFAKEPKHLSELLLLDVEAGLCETASRIEEAITAVQTFVQRARLGLEPGFTPSSEFLLLWDRHFATFRIWEECKRREIYRENWIEWDELTEARRVEGFRFLESELRRATLTIAVPGGLEYWDGERPPQHGGLTLLQAREPATIKILNPAPEGLGLLGTPDRHARPSWLAALLQELGRQEPTPDHDPDAGVTVPGSPRLTGAFQPLPFWIEAAIRLGVRFLRIAAAGVPPASTAFENSEINHGHCCVECGRPHEAVMDEYYFWLLDSRYFNQPVQEAIWKSLDWHKPEDTPELLYWESEPMVHLAWCRVHNGEFKQPRRSDEGVRIAKTTLPPLPLLLFKGRSGDSLTFEVPGGKAPIGFPFSPVPGFRYDLATDSAIVLPEVVASPAPALEVPGKLPVYPYFAYFAPGAPLFPPKMFSPALTVADFLRAHCRFEDALKWYELVIKPLQDDLTWSQCPRTRRPTDPVDTPVGVPTDPRDTPTHHDDVSDPDRRVEEEFCCQNSQVTDSVARRRALVLHYLETLLQWGEALMRRHSPEAFQQARLIFDTASRILGPHPETVKEVDTEAPQPLSTFKPHVPPLNPRLISLYESVADRLALIHVCNNARRLPNGRLHVDMSYWGDSLVRDGWRTTTDVCGDEVDWCFPYSPYRFMFLVHKAQEIANEVRTLGSALLAAFEKGDAEYLQSLRATHERQLLTLALEIRQNAWRESDWQVQALQKTKEISQLRKTYYETLILNGLNTGEIGYQAQIGISIAARTAAAISEGVAQAMGSVPDIWSGVAGFAGTPLFFSQFPVGSKLGSVFATAARIANVSAEIASISSSLSLTEGGFVRREEEWRYQVDVLTIELEQIERQILAAERKRDMALRELNNHQRQIENGIEVQNFLRDKFTAHELFLWLQKETAALHFRMYEIALATVRQAQRAFNFERGYTTAQFVPTDAWDNLHEGLLAGDRLALSLRQMEKSFLDQNLREYELTKHISLRQHFPVEFLRLKATGSCEFEIPEWMFDVDYPGQYLRRIKNVTLTLPCVVGPYVGVHCRLTLLSSRTRIDPRLSDPATECCSLHRQHNSYEEFCDDPRIVRRYAAKEAVATSTGQNDSGMFEVNFNDERYLPFELEGAVSRWRLELPGNNNQFDIDTLSDAILHLNYTSREGGDVLRQAANKVGQRRLYGPTIRFFDVKQEFPDEWRRFKSSKSEQRRLTVPLRHGMFAFLPGSPDLGIERLVILIEACGAQPSTHHIVKYLIPDPTRYEYDDDCFIGEEDIYCVASREWPDLYHGVMEHPTGHLRNKGDNSVQAFLFPSDIEDVSRVFLFFVYAKSRHAESIAWP